MQLLAHHGVGLLEEGDLVGGHLADYPHPQSRAGEGLAPHDLLGKAQFQAHRPHLVLEQGPQRLDQLEVEVVGQAADVVVALDGRRMRGAGLDHIGIQGPLHQVGGIGDPTLGVLEDPDEQLPDRLALLLGVGDARESLEEPVRRALVDQLDALVAPEGLHHLFALVLAHQPRVHEHTGQLGTDRPVDERRGHRRVDTTGQTTDRATGADLCTDVGDRVVDEVGHGPFGRTTGEVVQEAFDHVLAMGGVVHLGVELDTPDASLRILEHRYRCSVGGSRGPEALGCLGDRIEVAHPHRLVGRQAVQESTGRGRSCGAVRARGATRRLLSDVHDGAPVLPGPTPCDGATELLRYQLGAVADAEDRDPEVVDARIEVGGALHVDRLGTTGEDDGGRGAPGDLLGGDGVGHDLGVHPCLAHPPGDELCVLGAEVHHEHDLVGGVDRDHVGVGGLRVDCRADRVAFGAAHRISRGAVATNSAFCRSLRFSYPQTAIALRSAPSRLQRPSTESAGPSRIASRRPAVA